MAIWTKAEEETLRTLVSEDWLYKDIATELDRTFCSIQKKAGRLGISSPHKNNTKKPNTDYLKQCPKDIVPLQPYISARYKLLHKHLLCGHEWLAKPNSILNGRGCPKCKRFSFNNEEPAHVYCIYFKELGIYKVGISNDYTSRIKTFGHKAEIIYTRYFNIGKDAKDLETIWLKVIEPYKYNTGLLSSGNTETFKY